METVEDNILPLTHQDIADISDPGEAISIGIEHDIPLDELHTLEEMKQRLMCHFRLQDQGSYKSKMNLNIKSLGDADKAKRHQLTRLVKDVQSVFPDDEDVTRLQMVEGLLSQDGTSKDIRKDCEKRIGMLKDDECCILVSGEASAGKSSLLNLLFEEEILPSHVLPCTSAITVIKYGKTKHAKVLHRDGQHIEIPELDKEGLKRLHDYAFIQENSKPSSDDVYQKRRDDHDIAEIQVYLPLKFLEVSAIESPMSFSSEALISLMVYVPSTSSSIAAQKRVTETIIAIKIEQLKFGLVLLDTPGIGENEFLENYLMQYIRTHQILGFMYIIMSDVAKCVAEDRLVALMSLILKHQTSSTELIKFDPLAALFVCNRWDEVKDKRNTADTATSSLGKVWPEFQKSQVVFFSTKNAKRETGVNPGYITDDYIELLNGISRLANIAMERRIKATFRWLGSVLQRTVHYLRTIVRGIDMTEKERVLKKAKTKKKLHALNTKSQDVTRKLRNDVNKGVNDICEKVREYLKTPQARLQLTSMWGSNENELPDLHVCSGGWNWVKRHIEASIDSRFINLLEDWEKEECIIPELEAKLCCEAKLELCELEAELSQIEKTVQLDKSSKSSSANFENTFKESVANFATFEEDDEDQKQMSNKLRRMIGAIFKPFNSENKKEKKLKKYMKDSVGVAKHMAEKKLKALQQDKDTLRTFITELLQRPFNYIHHLETKIPNMIKSNEMILNKFEQEILLDAASRYQYTDMMIRIESIRRGLLEYGESYLFANDFDADDVQLVNVVSDKQICRRDSVKDLVKRGSTSEDMELLQSPYGLWTSVHTGKLKGKEGIVSVKIYNPSAGVENVSQEIAKIRCLLHKDVFIAEFLGIYQTPDSETPVQLYNGHLLSLRRYVHENGAKCNKDQLLLDTLSGLRYLHTKGLVHMELTLDTLTVDTVNGDVRLSGACLPRKAIFPSDPEDCPSSDFVYLPRDVLHGNQYNAASDIYCFAIMSLELDAESPLRVFEEERCWTVKQFRSFNATHIFESKLKASSFSKEMRLHLNMCLSANESIRPTASDLWAEFNRLMEKKPKRISVINGTVAPRHLWASYRKK